MIFRDKNRDKLENFSKMSLTFEGQNSGTEYSLSPKEEYLGNVPIGQWVHEQEQGGLKPPPL